MSFPWTLQRYIFIEMGKTFVLAVAALTAVLGLGGGIMNMIKLGEVTPSQLIRLMGLVLPLAAALTLPIAALFAATSTYGRLSADNEFVACRASGVNLHLLFVPTLALSLFAAAVSFALTNFLIPGMVRGLNDFVGSDVGALIRQRLNQPRGITLGDKYRIYADETSVDAADTNRVILSGVAFVEVDAQDWVRYGTAREVHLSIDRTEEGIRIAGRMRGLSCYDRKLDSFYEEGDQAIPPNVLPAPMPEKIKFLKLPELLYYWSRPTEWVDVREEIDQVRRAVGARLAYQQFHRDWDDDHTLTLTDSATRYDIQAGACDLIPGDRGVELADVNIKEVSRDSERSITAGRAMLELARGDSVSDSGLELDLYDVKLSDGTTTVERAKSVVGPVPLNPQLVAQVEALGDEELLRQRDAAPDDRLARRRAQAREELAKTSRRIVGAINERAAFSLSMFVLVILGAVLGIVFRGSHVMTAFGISFIPALIVIVAIMAGRQMSHNVGTHLMGLLVMWSGIVGVAGLDLWTLTKVLRR